MACALSSTPSAGLQRGAGNVIGAAGARVVSAGSVTLNVTTTNAKAAGRFFVYPGTGPEPTTVMPAAGRTRANQTVGLFGEALLVADHQEIGTVDVIIDITGYFR